MAVSDAHELTVVRAACPHDCPDTCAMLVSVRDGRAVGVRGDPEHPYTRGHLCSKVNRYPERVYGPDRLLHPLRRVGPKGEGRFERIGWDEAIASVAGRLTAIAESADGPQGILPYSYMGSQGIIQANSMDRRFFHRLGASLLQRNICAEAGVQGYLRTTGSLDSADPEDVAHAKLVVAWGVNILSTNQHLWPFVREARANGARLVTIDPLRTRTAAQSDQHLQLRPGTDAALALGMMQVILAEGLEDREYVARYTEGIEQLRGRAAEWPPSRAAEVTGLTEAEIVGFAREYATRRPAMIRLLLGLQRHAGGAMAVRAIACLPALVGAWQERGGGIHFITAGQFHLDWGGVQRGDLAPPGTREVNMTTLGRALTELEPPVRALVVYSSNPANIAPDQGRVLAGLRREDLFTVVLEQFPTDTTDFADVVLPVTSQLEHWDLLWSWGHHYLTLNRPAIAPLGEAKPTTEVFRLLAAAMGFDELLFRDSDEDLIRQALRSDSPRLAGITFERLREEGWAKLNLPSADGGREGRRDGEGDHLLVSPSLPPSVPPSDYRPFAYGGYGTPSGKCLLFNEGMVAEGLDPLPTFTPPRESRFADPALAGRFPLQLLTPKAHHFLNSTFGNVESLARDTGPRTVELHPEDAAARGLTDGQAVRVFNDRGEYRAVLRVSDAVRPGVALTLFGHWRRSSPDRSAVNATTSQAVTDMGAGPTFHDNLVEVEGVEENGQWSVVSGQQTKPTDH
jgi:anaerobic selenocysteine-containing dehydrogenase